MDSDTGVKPLSTVTSFIATNKYPIRINFIDKGFILAYNWGYTLLRCGRYGDDMEIDKEHKAAGHNVPTIKKQRKSHIQCRTPANGMWPPHLWWVFQFELIQSRNSLIDIPRGLSPQ